MARSRTSCALLLLLAAAAFNGCWAQFNADDFALIFGQGGNGGNGGNVVQLSKTNQVGIKNAAKTLQKATADGGAGGDGVVGRRLLQSDGFPNSFVLVGTGGNGGDGGRVYQRSVTNQVGFNNKAKTTQEASANGGNGGDGVRGRKLLQDGADFFPETLFLVGQGGNGGNGGNVVQYSVTNQVGVANTASTTQDASANGGNGGDGIKGRKLLQDDNAIFVFGQGGNGGKGGFIGQFSATNQVGFNNKASTKQKASANGGNGGDGVRG